MTRRVPVAKGARFWHFLRMKSFLAALLLLGGLLAARAQSQADDQYVGIYGLIQQADQLAQTGDPGEALAAYNDAQSGLTAFQKQFPNWNPNIVSFRLQQVAEKIADLKSRLPKPVAKPVAPPAEQTPAVTAPAASQGADDLRAQLQAAQAANEQLQAKLKEALATRPASVDPQELAQAQEKLRALMKENDLLKAAPAQTVTNFQTVTNLTMVYVTNTPAVVTNYAVSYVTNAPETVTNFSVSYVTNTVVQTFTNAIPAPDTNALEMAELERAAAVRNFNDEHDRAEQLDTELRKLRQSLAAPGDTNTGAALAALQAENAGLKTELEKLHAAPSSADELKQAQAQIAALQSAAEDLGREKISLQQKLEAALAASNAVPANAVAATADNDAQIQGLTKERDELAAKLAQATNAPAANPEVPAQLAALNAEVSVLRARLAVAEAQPAPFSADELALLKNATPQPAAVPAAPATNATAMSADTADLAVTAQKHFLHHEFDQAEADYLKILEHDQNNGIALANLATIELQQGKLDDAAKHVQAALAQSPDDAYNLSTLGYLKFRQEKYDEALNTLSRAAQIAPNNPEIQNYLGVTLSHLGQRKAAEAALRRAIQIAPDYAPAHNNLAVVYLSQNPPLAELARWHYQKAVDAGQPRNADLEKMLADKGAPVSQ